MSKQKLVTRKDLYLGSVLLFGGAIIWQLILPPPPASASPLAVHIAVFLGTLFAFVSYGVLYLLTDKCKLLRGVLARDLRGFAEVAKKLSYREVIVIALLAGFGEELLFRVFLQGWAVSLVGPMIGVALASLLFGLVHPVSIFYITFTSLLGLLFGSAYHLTGSYVLVAVWHFVYDLFAIAALKMRPGFYKNLTKVSTVKGMKN